MLIVIESVLPVLSLHARVAARGPPLLHAIVAQALRVEVVQPVRQKVAVEGQEVLFRVVVVAVVAVVVSIVEEMETPS